MKYKALLISIAITCYILAFNIDKIEISTYILYSCSVFILMFTGGEFCENGINLLERFRIQRNMKLSKYIKFNYVFFKIVSVIIYTSALPVSILLGIRMWNENIDEILTLEKMNGMTMLALGMLFASLAMSSIVNLKEK